MLRYVLLVKRGELTYRERQDGVRGWGSRGAVLGLIRAEAGFNFSGGSPCSPMGLVDSRSLKATRTARRKDVSLKCHLRSQAP